MALLDIRNLSVRVGPGRDALTVVDRISLTVNEGRILALVGASGSGKSLLMQAVMMLRRDNLSYSADRFKLDGEDLLKIPSRKRRRIIGQNISFIMQDPRQSLDPTMKIRDQIYEVMPRIPWYHVLSRLKNFFRRTRSKTAAALLHRSGIRDHERILGSYPAQLSDVECQKIMLAIALASKPRILLLDEPVVNLETASRLQVLKLLDRCAKNDRTAVVVICNDLASVYNFADEFAFMYAGQIVERGSRDRILNNPRHPYTAALIRTMLELGRNGRLKRYLPVLSGKHPDYRSMPVGCRFGARCRRARRECNRDPEMIISKNEQYRCHFPLEDGALYEDE